MLAAPKCLYIYYIEDCTARKNSRYRLESALLHGHLCHAHQYYVSFRTVFLVKTSAKKKHRSILVIYFFQSGKRSQYSAGAFTKKSFLAKTENDSTHGPSVARRHENFTTANLSGNFLTLKSKASLLTLKVPSVETSIVQLPTYQSFLIT